MLRPSWASDGDSVAGDYVHVAASGLFVGSEFVDREFALLTKCKVPSHGMPWQLWVPFRVQRARD